MSAVLATYPPSRYAVCSVLHLVELRSQVRVRVSYPYPYPYPYP